MAHCEELGTGFALGYKVDFRADDDSSGFYFYVIVGAVHLLFDFDVDFRGVCAVLVGEGLEILLGSLGMVEVDFICVLNAFVEGLTSLIVRFSNCNLTFFC